MTPKRKSFSRFPCLFDCAKPGLWQHSSWHYALISFDQAARGDLARRKLCDKNSVCCSTQRIFAAFGLCAFYIKHQLSIFNVVAQGGGTSCAKILKHNRFGDQPSEPLQVVIYENKSSRQ